MKTIDNGNVWRPLNSSLRARELMTCLCSIFHFSSDGTASHIQDEECALLKSIVVWFCCCQLGASEIYELLVAVANLWPELRGEIVEGGQ